MIFWGQGWKRRKENSTRDKETPPTAANQIPTIHNSLEEGCSQQAAESCRSFRSINVLQGTTRGCALSQRAASLRGMARTGWCGLGLTWHRPDPSLAPSWMQFHTRLWLREQDPGAGIVPSPFGRCHSPWPSMDLPLS